MLYAENKDGTKVKACKSLEVKKNELHCPLCKGEVIFKPGKIKISHFAHKSRVECDSWSEESEWHLGWKELVNEKYCEVTIDKHGVRHRADIRNRNGLVIELQHSSISTEIIRARESFYQKMIWLFDVPIFKFRRFSVHDDGIKCSFWWIRKPRTIWSANKRIFLDLGNGNILYMVKDRDGKYKKSGKGYLIPKNKFIDAFLIGDENKSQIMQTIRKLQGIDSGQFFEQLNLYIEYGEWLADYLRKIECNNSMYRRFNYYPSKGLHEKGYTDGWCGLSTVYDFIKSHPQYEDKHFEIIKIITRGDNEGWNKYISRKSSCITQRD
ncbi:MAG: hypothetical protein JXA98_02460 [Methanosarcinaceae archaeon]|nr:hypothetical protein [Methanosarcinaceae archaeon]